MGKRLLVLVTLGIALILTLSSCVLMGREEDQAANILKEFVNEMVGIYEEYGENWEGGSNAVKNVMEKYIYLDDSLENYHWGDEEGIDAAKDWIAGMIYGHIGMWNATKTFNVEEVEIKTPTDVPTSLADDVESYAEITISCGEATGQAYAVKVRGKWYVEAIGWDDEYFSFYPWGFVPEIYVGSSE